MSNFVALHNFPTLVEAEMNAELLRAAGITPLLQGPQSGMFGAGFSGMSVQGVTLLVPADDLERALELIGDSEE